MRIKKLIAALVGALMFGLLPALGAMPASAQAATCAGHPVTIDAADALFYDFPDIDALVGAYADQIGDEVGASASTALVDRYEDTLHDANHSLAAARLDGYEGPIVLGTPGDDVIVGTNGAEWILGLDGNDVICGRKGDDYLTGGAGADLLLGNAGQDTISGSGTSADDVLMGGAGFDVLVVDLSHDEPIQQTDLGRGGGRLLWLTKGGCTMEVHDENFAKITCHGAGAGGNFWWA